MANRDLDLELLDIISELVPEEAEAEAEPEENSGT